MTAGFVDALEARLDIDRRQTAAITCAGEGAAVRAANAKTIRVVLVALGVTGHVRFKLRALLMRSRWLLWQLVRVRSSPIPAGTSAGRSSCSTHRYSRQGLRDGPSRGREAAARSVF